MEISCILIGIVYCILTCTAQAQQVEPVRLVDGVSSYEGRVEVLVDGIWGTICDDYWDNNDARVICRSLGLPGGIALNVAFFGPGDDTMPIWMDDVSCVGTEASINLCPFNGWNVHNCWHLEDASVRCSDVEVRIVDGPTVRQGRVEIHRLGVWGAICDDNFTDEDATVVCRESGYDVGVAHVASSYGTADGPIMLDELGCVGTENYVESCTHAGWNNHDCNMCKHAGVQCQETMRLVGGASPYEGRVEILHNGVWGTVHIDLWDDVDASVVCVQLGTTGGFAVTNGFFGPGTGRIWIMYVECGGTEVTLAQCSHHGWDNLLAHVNHWGDAGVVCDTPAVTVPTTRVPIICELPSTIIDTTVLTTLQTTQLTTEQTTQLTTEQTTEVTTEQTTEVTTEQTTEVTTEQTTEQSTQYTTVMTTEEQAVTTTASTVQSSVGLSTEQTSEQSTSKTTQQSTWIPSTYLSTEFSTAITTEVETTEPPTTTTTTTTSTTTTPTLETESTTVNDLCPKYGYLLLTRVCLVGEVFMLVALVLGITIITTSCCVLLGGCRRFRTRDDKVYPIDVPNDKDFRSMPPISTSMRS